MTQLAAAVRTPTGPAFTVVLVFHVASVLLALVAAVSGAVAAIRVLTARGELPRSVRSYFSPGFNWAGRVLYLVPVFGGALLAMSGGAYSVGAPWVEWGIGLWAGALALGEVVVWPAERRVQRGLEAGGDGSGDAGGDAGGDTRGDAGSGAAGARVEAGVPDHVRRACRTMVVATGCLVAFVVAAMVVMFVKT